MCFVSTCSVWESPGCGTRDEDNNETSGFSEHELLDIMYNTCNTSSTGTQASLDLNKTDSNDHINSESLFLRLSHHLSGEVSASTIVQYLQTMTSQSPEQDRLASLRRLLDPDCQDPHVSREAFHSTMREWIAQCSQDR